MPEPRYHRQLRLQNFTVFKDATFDFVDGINAFIGENGSGKTHLMKVMFAVHLSASRGNSPRESLERVFQLRDSGELIRQKGGNAESHVEGIYGTDRWQYRFRVTDREDKTCEDPLLGAITRPVFIPSMDMMGHTRGFASTYDEYNIDFDLTQRDIVGLLLSPERRSINGKGYTEIAQQLHVKLGGDVEKEGERFYLNTGGQRQPMPLVAEGLRKIATLHQLIKNGFLQPGASLFWDEPEVHLNPSLMDEVVQALLELSRQGVQIFLATHSYVILKELEVQARKGDSLRFFSLERTDDGTQVHTAGSYLDLQPNLIEQQYLSLYDRAIEKRVSEAGAGE